MTVRSKLTLLVALAAGISVLGYNLWSYSCGHCTLNSLMTLGPAGYLLLGVNAGLAGLLLILKRKHRVNARRCHCRCGALVLSDWLYCPACGEEKKT